MLLNEFLEKSARLYPDKIALVCQSKRLTYAAISSKSSALANSLIKAGVQRQERVVIFLENSVESVISIFGILKAGGIFVIINPLTKPRKLAYVIANSQAKTLITDVKHCKQISERLEDMTSLKRLIISDSEFETGKIRQDIGIQVFSMQYMTDESPSILPMPRCIDIDLASLIYTSGSTGNPKGVMLTHLNMVSAIYSITQYLENSAEDIIIDTLPLSFDYGLYQLLMAFQFGGTVVLEKGFVFPEQIIKTVVNENVTGWPIVPTIAAILCQLKNLEKHDFSKVRYITSTGQVLPPKHISRLKEVFPKTKIYSMYGLTECKRVSYLPPEEIENRPSSVGKAMPNTEAYIVGNFGEEILEPGEIGELVVRGSNVMRGYWNLPEETHKALRPGRYPGETVLFTGDLFKKDNLGYLYFVGRKDDIIKTSGHMVSPKEIENVLCEIEDVIEAAVVGADDEIMGQSIKAFIHLVDGSKVNEKDIKKFCYKYLEDYSIPSSITFCGPLPKSNNGKIQKQDLY